MQDYVMVSSAKGTIPAFPEGPLPVAISGCLTGEPVRPDGGHKKSSIPHDRLNQIFSFRPVCPEVGIGMGVPREAIRLVGEPSAPRAVGSKNSALDLTEKLATYADDQQSLIDDVDGYVFMKNSPTCGLYRVKVYRDNGIPDPSGQGVYAARVRSNHPNLPVEESGRLNDPVLRENFVTRVFVHAHWRSLVDQGLSAQSLIGFHSAYKYLVLAHSVSGYRKLGRLLSNLSGSLEAIAEKYIAELMRSLSEPATRGRHANAMSHLQGHARKSLTGSARRELAELIDRFRTGEVPLMAPLVLLQHHLRGADSSYALSQHYLQPHPASAGLRREL
jgi:uncharacterized protein YbgA (DUF1722 family)/uncharacterized protein YbbK (DUF523 family)